MSDAQVREEILTLFLAGHETTANALSWTWYLLSQNPDAERRLFEEVDSLLGASPGLCGGERLTWMEGVLILARVAQHWRVRLAPSARIVPQPVLTLRLKHGLPVIPERRVQ